MPSHARNPRTMCDIEKPFKDEHSPFTVTATREDGTTEELEVEVYVKVNFRVQTWDGQVREHEADLPGHVAIKYLKEELEHELGDPKLSDWVIAKNNMPMSDDHIIFNTYPIQHGEQINVIVHNPNSRSKRIA